jgi:hypothetical protein
MVYMRDDECNGSGKNYYSDDSYSSWTVDCKGCKNCKPQKKAPTPEEIDSTYLPKAIPMPAARRGVALEIEEVCDEIKEFLIGKNEQYGNSALDPVRIFSSASNEEQLRVRIDDKLSRLVRGTSSIEADSDIVADLIGYFIMWKVLHKRNENG